MNISVADYIANFLAEKNLNTIFAITGASAIRIIDSIHRHSNLRYFCPHHEQAGVMSAIGYFRKTGQPGVMVVTAGPGGTNSITGVASAYLDSIPLILIAGQEKSEFLSNDLRGKGVQGLNLPSIVKPICKKAIKLESANQIGAVLNEAYYLATTGRPGPVWIDVPQDLQTRGIDPEKIEVFTPPPVQEKSYDLDCSKFFELLGTSRRPLIWVGHGVRLSKSESDFLKLADKLKVPILTAWNGADLLHEEHPFYFGRAGTYGNRHANIILQNCDLLIGLGTRLAIPQMGYSAEEFAPFAKKVIVEIDPTELAKFQFTVDLPILGDVGKFIRSLLNFQSSLGFQSAYEPWLEYCNMLKRRFPVVTEGVKAPINGKVNSYHFIETLSEHLIEGDNIVTDMGTSLTCTHAAIKLKKNQRLITSTGLGEMGFGLPCAIGVGIASKQEGSRVVFIGAEGSLMMNLQEFQTLVHNKVPIKIFILNNNSYLTIFHTENALFGGGRLSACGPETGVSFPSLKGIASAFGIKYMSIDDSKRMSGVIHEVLSSNETVLCDVFMPNDQFLGPKSALKVKEDGTLYSPPLEDLYPFIDAAELESVMIAKKVNNEAKS